MKYEIKGAFRIGDRRQEFKLKIEATNERLAREKAYLHLGSKHACKRRFIKIEEVLNGKK